MNKSYTIVGGIIGFLVLIGLFIGGSYNSLVGAQTKVEQAQSKISQRPLLTSSLMLSIVKVMKHEVTSSNTS